MLLAKLTAEFTFFFFHVLRSWWMIWSMSDRCRDLIRCLKLNICKGCGIGEPRSTHLNWEGERSFSSCEHGGRPVIEDVSFCWIASSSDWRRWLHPGMVLHREIHLFFVPWMKAAYTACSWVAAIATSFQSFRSIALLWYPHILQWNLRSQVQRPDVSSHASRWWCQST